MLMLLPLTASKQICKRNTLRSICALLLSTLEAYTRSCKLMENRSHSTDSAVWPNLLAVRCA